MGNMELLASALEYVETHLEEDVRTEDVAKACFCAKSTLEKLFRCVMNISVHDYMVRRRMMKAAKLLHGNPEVNVLSVALQFGYSTNESFTRAFRFGTATRPNSAQSRGIRSFALAGFCRRRTEMNL